MSYKNLVITGGDGGDKGSDGIIHTCSKCGAPTRIETFDGM